MNSQPISSAGSVECPFCGLFNPPTASRCKCGKGLAFARTPTGGDTRSELDYLRSINNSLSSIKHILFWLLVVSVGAVGVYVVARFPGLYR